MTRPAARPLDFLRQQLHAHRRVFGEATIVVATLLFLALGTVISMTLLPNLR